VGCQLLLGGLRVVLVQAFADQAMYLCAESVVEQAAEMGLGGHNEALILVAGASLLDMLRDFTGENFVLVLLRLVAGWRAPWPLPALCMWPERSVTRSEFFFRLSGWSKAATFSSPLLIPVLE